MVLALALVASDRLQHSRIGWAWQAIREDELAARAMGINTTVAKLQAFAIGACVRRVRRRAARLVATSVFPENFLFTESINVLAMVIIGGMGSLAGVILGAIVIVALPEVFRDFAGLSPAGVRSHADGADGVPAAGVAGAARLACTRTEQAPRLIAEQRDKRSAQTSKKASRLKKAIRNTGANAKRAAMAALSGNAARRFRPSARICAHASSREE